MVFIMAIVNINELKKEVGCAFTPLLISATVCYLGKGETQPTLSGA